MELFIILVMAIGPGIFWLLYFYSKDKMEPEPHHLVIRTFFIGALAAVPIAFAEYLFVWTGPLLLLIAVAPIFEEYGKFLSVKIFMSRHPEFDEPLDGIIYAVAAALGFASIENVLYLIAAANDGTESFIVTAIARAFLSVPGHAIFACMWGYALGMSMLIADSDQKRKFVRLGVWTAILFHSVFNFLAFMGSFLGLIAAAALILFVALGWKQVKQRIDAALIATPKFVVEKSDELYP